MRNLWDKRIIIHVVITGLTVTALEPNVPDLYVQINGYKEILSKLGPQKTILRVDPVIPTIIGVKRAKKVIEKLIVSSEQRIRISFMDNYNHVKERFIGHKLPLLPYNFHAPLDQRVSSLEQLQQSTKSKIEVCSEPGLQCSGCISSLDCKLLNIHSEDFTGYQRKACKCCSKKYELLSNNKRCPHGCLYCYWKD